MLLLLFVYLVVLVTFVIFQKNVLYVQRAEDEMGKKTY